MADAVLRAFSTSFDVDAFLRQHPELDPSHVWHRGERSLGKRVYDSSGFNLAVAAGEDAKEALAEITKTLERWTPALEQL
jgi:hypothetical protein